MFACLVLELHLFWNGGSILFLTATPPFFLCLKEGTSNFLNLYITIEIITVMSSHKFCGRSSNARSSILKLSSWKSLVQLCQAWPSKYDLELASLYSLLALFGCSLEWPRTDFDRLLEVSNKDRLQNRLQNPCGRNFKEFNETFDRIIRGRLL